VDGRPRRLLFLQPHVDQVSECVAARGDSLGSVDPARLHRVAAFLDEILDAFALFARLREFDLADTERALDTSVPLLQLPRCRTAIQLTKIESSTIA
jgi:hypothetical protein